MAFGVADSGTADATAVRYTVTVTEAPYNGQAKPGQPGYADPDREAQTVRCHNNNDALLS